MKTKDKFILHDHNKDGLDRRGFLECMAWAGTGASQPREQSALAQQASHPAIASTATGKTLFLRNCAHCHGADAHGDEGPDLHNLGWTDEQITTRIRNGKAGQMTAFKEKLRPSEIDSLVAYVRALK